jgi:hypothetical protein
MTKPINCRGQGTCVVDNVNVHRFAFGHSFPDKQPGHFWFQHRNLQYPNVNSTQKNQDSHDGKQPEGIVDSEKTDQDF